MKLPYRIFGELVRLHALLLGRYYVFSLDYANYCGDNGKANLTSLIDSRILDGVTMLYISAIDYGRIIPSLIAKYNCGL
jgi:hypothetical protein